MRSFITILSALALLILPGCNTAPKLSGEKIDTNELNGTWELEYISGPRIAFNGLYPDKKPSISFNVNDKQINGHSSCNNFSGPFTIEGYNVDFNGPLVSTRMACPGSGEPVFFETLKKITRYNVTDSTILNLIMGDITMMRFRKLAN